MSETHIGYDDGNLFCCYFSLGKYNRWRFGVRVKEVFGTQRAKLLQIYFAKWRVVITKEAKD